MTLLDLYLLRALVRGGAPVFLLLLSLFGFVALAEQLEDVGKGAFGTLEAVRVTGFLLPRIALELLPVTCLLGAVVGLGTLGNQTELTAMRTGGLSVSRLSRPLLLLLFALAAAALVAQQAVIPGFEGQAAYLRAQSFASTAKSGDAFWTRSKSSLVRIGGVAYGAMPQDLEIYELDPEGRVAQLTQAAAADVLAPGEWLLRDVRRIRFRAAGIERSAQDRLRWRSDLTPEQVVALVRTDQALAPADLFRYIAHLDDNGLDAHRYRVLLWQQLGLAAGLVGMGLLGVPFALGAMRATSLGARLSLCALIGLGFHLLEQGVMQLGLLYRLSPVLTGLAPDLAVLAAALAIMRTGR